MGPTPVIDDNWPLAIDPTNIVPSDGDAEKQFRALQIMSVLKTPLNDKTVLDCGCGEGHNSREMANTATKVVGYDIKPNDGWSDRAKENLILTADKTEVATHGPYDFIVLYDVIDHLQGEDPEAFLQWISSMLKENGNIFVRAHPWTAKTGGHLYEQINKAWIQLALTPDELAKAGWKLSEPNLRVIKPMAAYEVWFKSAGLTINSKKIKSTEVEGLSDEIVDRIIKVSWGGTIDAKTARRIIANEWIDYNLKSSAKTVENV